ncbi:Non-specific lipid-transfer protein 8 [Morus notabilis]|uniref:Non-specific lipid-transfer protein n=1 Tax=Morus notabilis TaxID=981085 RepID=W9SJS9_9ROSA|nr:non-specific lipid-transfer protein 4.1 [Morus notabilis]XP_010111952.1 non-specific lipid-transfer protein 4.1 [Morus notabilis]XP_010113123.1 non-specific lipid-transfer protein 4.1 [Morus notabilis]EXC32133.1 Non-specific lipid-transfer protein 8 [Morus notabilis]EXC46296.1 Non-specific lipid-transfer protein 8 [Morus notabilis]EXC66404.1 Non-specific lipid-transfer protein 8 [Morus notabilis]
MEFSSSEKIAGPKVASDFVLLLLLTVASEATISCKQVVLHVQPWVSGNGKPPAVCCAVASKAPSSADKRAACECIKSASKFFKIKPNLAEALPQNCGIKLPFTVSLNMDCSKYCSIHD